MPDGPFFFVKNGETIIKIGENVRKMNNGHAYIEMDLRCTLSYTQENNYFLLTKYNCCKNNTFNVFVHFCNVFVLLSEILIFIGELDVESTLRVNSYQR